MDGRSAKGAAIVIIETAELETPIGPIVLAMRAGSLCAVGFDGDWSRVHQMLRRRFPAAELRSVEDPGGFLTRMRAYFDGDLTALDSIPVDLGGTPFQAKVWNALRRIPAGQTISYGDLALAIGEPKAVRAVGLANGANPVAIVVPCHRVIGADGSLTGYGGGIERKRWLLAHERKETTLSLFP
jgi:methylated-DNA-[protein]-cysteine S-methyltransferase